MTTRTSAARNSSSATRTRGRRSGVRHTQEPIPPPPVDFAHQVVIAAIQGLQPTTGGPIISIVGVEPEGPFARIIIIDDERPGPVPEVSNPFHIVAVQRQLLPPMRSVTFQHLRPFPESGTVAGHVFAPQPGGEPRPLPGAHVMLARDNAEPRHAMAGLDGSFCFVNVEPGDYMLFAEHPGFEPAEAPIFVPPNGLVAHNFFLEPVPPGTIAGHVMGVAPPPEPPFPLPDSLVRLFRENVEVARCWTNNEGFFVFEDILPGEYRLVAAHQGFQPQQAIVVVEPGGVVEHMFFLEPCEPPGAFAGQVRGLLSNGQEVPLPGALVRLLRPNGEVCRARTNHQGIFVMPHVPPGHYLAIATKFGWLPGQVEVDIVSGEVTHHAFLLERP